MSTFLMGKKIGMTQIFKDNGDTVPVTVIQAGPCIVCQKKTPEKDNYSAVQLGFLPKKPERVKKPLAGHFKKAGVTPQRFLREFRVDEKDAQGYEAGQELKVDRFKDGDYVDITGTSKGRGFAGVIKRHGFHGAPGSHGTHDNDRHGGSVGSSSFPSRVFKGLRMAGRMGCDRVTVQNLKVIQVRPEQDCLLVQGAVPGAKNGVLLIRKAIKKA
ncbi:50S ribosomal protein L3 [bacterium]|nr:50S ribosomal protein L3 [bacterium]